MPLITKKHLSVVLQTIKKLLSFKADKEDVILKNEISDPIDIVAEMELVSPIAADDGSIYTDNKGVVYTL